ncbi:MAG: SIMPL domain-containing protein [Archaeoglobaceae archaeon]
MDSKYIVSLILVVGLLLGSVIVSVANPSTAQQDQEKINELHVSGSGEVEVDPDQVIIELGVEVTEDTAQDAREKNAQQTNSVIRAIKAMGISEDQIETIRFSIYEENKDPRVKEENGDQNEEKVSYRAVNTIRIISNDTDMAAEIIDTAISSGANDVDRVSFTLQKATRDQAREQAIKKAIEDARKEAQNVVQEMSLTLDQPVNIEVYSTGIPRLAMERADAGTGTGTTSTPIEPGKVTVTANINVIYAFTAQ